MNIQIRKAENTDQKAIESLNQIASDEDLTKYSNQKKNIFSLEEYFNKGGYFWIAEDILTHKIVGMIALKRINERQGKVKALRVHPNVRRKGIGKLLLERLETYCRKNNYKEIILGVNEKTLAARSLYLSVGFIKFAEKKFHSSVTAFYFKKVL